MARTHTARTHTAGGRRARRAALACVAAACLLLPAGAARPDAGSIAPAPAAAAAGDFAGRVAVGGRRLYLACAGTGAPTVVLESGYRASARVWREDMRAGPASPPRVMVFAGVAAFTRVCAYDRPGTVAPRGDAPRPSRSDPVAQPRRAGDIVADLHALLHAAAVPGPYVLVGHSLGGLFVRLYASRHPDEVAGMVLVDPYSERLASHMTPAQWRALVAFNRRAGSDTVEPIPGYGDLETLPYGASDAVMRAAAAAAPLRPMPLAVLAHGRPFALPDPPPDLSAATLEADLRAANADLATLVPRARFFVAAGSGHDIHQDQPTLVVEAIRQLVEGVRHPDTWRDLAACCAR